eukprot:12901862-Prorocentrum_lima.AAC.1
MRAVSSGTAAESERVGACLDTPHCNSNPVLDLVLAKAGTRGVAQALHKQQEGVVEAAVTWCKQASRD